MPKSRVNMIIDKKIDTSGNMSNAANPIYDYPIRRKSVVLVSLSRPRRTATGDIEDNQQMLAYDKTPTSLINGGATDRL